MKKKKKKQIGLTKEQTEMLNKKKKSLKEIIEEEINAEIITDKPVQKTKKKKAE